MDLRSSQPYWTAVDAAPVRYPALTRDVECDVAVVGAGVSGAFAAYELARAGLRVVVVDRRQPGRGSTAASTALLMKDLDVPLHVLAATMGEASAARCYCMGAEAIERIAEVTKTMPGRCGFERRASLHLAHNAEAAAMLEQEIVAQREAGLDVRGLSRAELFAQYGIDAPGALWSARAGEIDPYLFTHALLDDAADHGALVFGGSRVELPEAGKDLALRSDAGGTVRAEKVVIAGGFESAGLLRGALRVHGSQTQDGEEDSHPRLLSSFAVVTTPVLRGEWGKWEDRALIWNTEDPYLYLRTTRDGRIVIGGLDEATADAAQRDAMVSPKAEELMRRLRALMPWLRVEPAYAWGGFFIETPDGLPYIGAIEGRESVYASLCYAGNGTTFAAIGARVLRELIVEGRSRDAGLVGVGRKRGTWNVERGMG